MQSEMKYRTIDGIKNPVSRIVFGCCNPILMYDEKGAEDLLDSAYDVGFNTFDCAKVYGKSEEVLGRWIRDRSNREQITVITKGCHPDDGISRINTDALKEDIESSLKRLQTDYIDIYLLHRDDLNADMRAVLGALDAYVRQGVIRKIGVSNWTHHRIEAVNKMADEMGLHLFSVSSPQMSLARQVRDPWGGGCVSISWDKQAMDWYTKHSEVSVFPYSCLGRGLFSGKVNSKHLWGSKRYLDHQAKQGYWCRENIKRLRAVETLAKEKGYSVAQIALAWCMSQNYSTWPIVTVSSKRRMKDDLQTFEISLNKEEWETLA